MGGYQMTLSAILPCYNRGHLLHWALRSLLNQSDRADEIIVIDDGSDDATEAITRRTMEEYPNGNIQYHFNNNPGWTICVHALNCGIQIATGDILMLTEPEVLHPSDDIAIMRRYFEDERNQDRILIGSPLYCVYEEALKHMPRRNLEEPRRILEMGDLIHEWHQGYCSPPNSITYFPRGGTHHIAGVMRRHMLAIGGYDEGFIPDCASGYDDIDMLTRLRNYGVKEERTEGIVAIHLDHAPPPPYVQDEETKQKNFRRMQTREPDKWEVNQGTQWGILRR